MKRFAIAPMDAWMGGLTALVLVLPVVFLGVGLRAPELRVLHGGIAMALVGLAVGVWTFCRPLRFEVDEHELRVVFPMWTRRIPRAVVTGVKRYPGDDFRSEVGWGMRIGVGGLFGGFGWLYTPIGLLEFYITRVGDLVLVTCEGRRDLLISPNDWDGLALAIEEWLS